MSDSSSYGFGGKLVVAVILALLCGYLWACFEEGKNPLALIKAFLPAEAPEPAKAAPPPKDIAKSAPPPVAKKEPVKAVEAPIVKPAAPTPAPAAPKLYSAVDMSILFNETD